MSFRSERLEKSPRIMSDTLGWVRPIHFAAACWVSPRRRMAFLISMTRPVLILSFSASGRPRSAYTLPEPRCTSIPSINFFSILYLLCKRLGHLLPGVNYVHFLFRRGDAALTLFLETVKNKHRFLELHGVNSPIGAT